MKPGIEVAIEFAANEQIVIFLSNCLTNTETWYKDSEWECLIIVRCLTKIK